MINLLLVTRIKVFCKIDNMMISKLKLSDLQSRWYVSFQHEIVKISRPSYPNKVDGLKISGMAIYRSLLMGTGYKILEMLN